MSVQQIPKLEELLPLKPNQKVISQKVTNLTKPGDNYGSLMLKLDVTVNDGNQSEELHLVGKMVPPNEFIQKIFNTQVTFRNEIGFFRDIVPLLEQFQRERGVEKCFDISAKYYGSRLNLKNDQSIVDNYGALILENLQTSGFVGLDRLAGVGYDVAKLVLENLARLHAVPLAVKILKPDVFHKEIKKYLSPWSMDLEMLEQNKTILKGLFEKTDKITHLQERVLQGFDRMGEYKMLREDFATWAHNDMWTCNSMFKFKNGKIVENKIVDYQICDYGSLAKDVVFFIFSSVHNDIIENHYDDLLKFYHSTFIGILKELNCPTDDLTYQEFLKEIDYEAKYSQLGHLCFMIPPIYAPKEEAKGVNELSSESLTWNYYPLQIEKFIFVFQQFAKRNWI